MAIGKPALYLGLDALSVSAATVTRGLGGPRLAAFHQVPLAQGALVVSASSRNLARPEEVVEAVRRAVAAAGAPAGPATLVIPDGVARIALLALPPDADARELVRFRLASSLPWDPDETIVEALPAGRGQVVGAALRRARVLEHEQVAAAAGLSRGRAHLAAFLALEPLLHASAPDAVHVVLGDAAATFAATRGGALLALRSRRRDSSPGEAGRLVADAVRLARAVSPPLAPTVAFAGVGADAIRREAALGGAAAVLPGRAEGAERPAWIEGIAA